MKKKINAHRTNLLILADSEIRNTKKFTKINSQTQREYTKKWDKDIIVSLPDRIFKSPQMNEINSIKKVKENFSWKCIEDDTKLDFFCRSNSNKLSSHCSTTNLTVMTVNNSANTSLSEMKKEMRSECNWMMKKQEEKMKMRFGELNEKACMIGFKKLKKIFSKIKRKKPIENTVDLLENIDTNKKFQRKKEKCDTTDYKKRDSIKTLPQITISECDSVQPVCRGNVKMSHRNSYNVLGTNFDSYSKFCKNDY